MGGVDANCEGYGRLTWRAKERGSRCHPSIINCTNDISIVTSLFNIITVNEYCKYRWIIRKYISPWSESYQNLSALKSNSHEAIGAWPN